jgi:hypothetical protein
LLKTLLGYNGNPSLTEVTAYILYYLVLWMFGIRINKQKESQFIKQEATR